MSYLTVISLEEAKTHLRIDDTASDTEVTRMINSACSYIENYTNQFLVAGEKSYNADENGCVRVYDYPINSVTSPTKYEVKKKATFNNYTIESEAVLILNIGYTNPLNIPSELKESALAMISVWFYQADSMVNTSLIPLSIKQALDGHKRFII